MVGCVPLWSEPDKVITMRHCVSFFCIASLLLGSSALAVDITVPPLGVTRTDQPVTFTKTTFDAPAVASFTDTDTLTLSVPQGSISLGQTTDLIFSDGDGVDDTSMTFLGSEDAVNASLDGLTYTPPPGFAGSLHITLQSGDTQASVRVTVNGLLDADAARAQILAGVTTIHSGVQPGRMVAYGPEAYDVAWFVGDVAEGPMIAVASMGAGRVLAVPDHQMLNMNNYGADSGTFYLNGLTWLAGSDDKAVSIVTRSDDVALWLKAQGYTDVTVSKWNKIQENLAEAAIFIPPWMGSNVSEDKLEIVREFVRNGGALFLAEYGTGFPTWWGKPVYEAPGNLLLREAGIGFADGLRWDTETIDANGVADGQVHALNLAAMLADPTAFEASLLDRGGVLLGRIFDVLNPQDPLAQWLDTGVWAAVEQINPTPATPVSSNWEKGLLLRELTALEATPVEEVTKHRTAEAVFGVVPDDAPRVTRQVTIDPTVTRWHSTGLYAAPGEVVTVSIPASSLGKGFKIKLSGHRDDLSGKDNWKRMPRVHRSFDILEETTQVASAFGGAVYFATGNHPLDEAPFDITITNAVEAPYFVLGETTDDQWNEGIRDNPAPYAELKCGRLQISLPSKFIKELSNPTDLMAFWDHVVELEDQLGMQGHLRSNGERINIDVQISLGWLHSGYPTQGPHGAAEELVSLDNLLINGSWGWFHELGHESQRRPDKSWPNNNPYTFDGSVECTVNLFTSYVYDTLNIPSRGGWGWGAAKADVMRRALESLEAGETYGSVGVGVKLAMFLELRDGWGWEYFQQVFEGYHDDDANQPSIMPSNEQEKRDQWLMRFSNVIGHNIIAFMRDYWGIPISDEAAAAVDFMPPWLPAVGGIEGVIGTRVGEPVTLDLQGEALSHDGVALIQNVTTPDQGTLEDGGDGTWTYTPLAGFSGKDSFDYTVVSSTGHTSVSTVVFNVSDNGVRVDHWFGIPGAAVNDLTSHPDFPDAPHETGYLPTMATAPGGGDNYGVRLQAFLIPPESGDYVFWVASDDNGELWLGKDHDPATKTLIASVPQWTNANQWKKFPEQESIPVTLEKGNAIYIEALMKQGGGGDNLSVAWALAGDTPQVISQEHVKMYRNTNVAPIAQDDSAKTDMGVAVTLPPLANDSDADGDPLYVLSTTATEHGITPKWNDDGTLTYQPPGGFEGIDRFSYTIADGYGGESTAEVIIEVGSVTPDPGGDTPGGDTPAGDTTGGDTGNGDVTAEKEPGAQDEGCGATPHHSTGALAFITLLCLLLVARLRGLGSAQEKNVGGVVLRTSCRRKN
jgi:hypothetical protein